MTKNTKEAIRAILAADSTVQPEDAANAIKLLSGNADKEKPLGRVIKCAEAARLCGVTTQALRNWARAGIVQSVYAGNNAQRIGYTNESIRALIDGKAGSKK